MAISHKARMMPAESAEAARTMPLDGTLRTYMTRHDSDDPAHQAHKICDHPRWRKRGVGGASSTDRVYVQGDCPICGHWQVPIPGAGQRVIEWLDKNGHHQDMATCPVPDCRIKQQDAPNPG